MSNMGTTRPNVTHAGQSWMGQAHAGIIIYWVVMRV
jgi:hypothetical protein